MYMAWLPLSDNLPMRITVCHDIHNYFLIYVLHTSQVYTMPQYLKKRYGGERIRMIYAAMQMLIIIISLIAVSTRKKDVSNINTLHVLTTHT